VETRVEQSAGMGARSPSGFEPLSCATEEIEEENAALPIRVLDPGDGARAVGEQCEAFSVKEEARSLFRWKRSSRPSRIRTRRSARPKSIVASRRERIRS
jgi:hypothetical protein